MSGLELAKLGRPPKVGDTIDYEEVRIEVLSLSGHGVQEALVTVIDRRSSRFQS